MHRAASFADFGQASNGFQFQQQYGQRGDTSTGVHEFHDNQGAEQYHPAQMLHRTPSMPQHPYYVTEQSNPGIATMNTNHVQHTYHQVPRQQIERPTLDIPYPTTRIAASIQSSPSSFSAASGRSPSMQEGIYPHQPTQTATYALHAASPIDSQQSVMQYTPQIQVSHQPQHAVSEPPTTEHYPQPVSQPEAEPWYYQPPVEVATIGQLPAYGTGVYDIYGPKIEFDDPTMQLPSSRLESL